MGVEYRGSGRAPQKVCHLLDLGAARKEGNLDRFVELAFLQFIHINKFTGSHNLQSNISTSVSNELREIISRCA
jgi:hypothetical protein